MSCHHFFSFLLITFLPSFSFSNRNHPHCATTIDRAGATTVFSNPFYPSSPSSSPYQIENNPSLATNKKQLTIPLPKNWPPSPCHHYWSCCVTTTFFNPFSPSSLYQIKNSPSHSTNRKQLTIPRQINCTVEWNVAIPLLFPLAISLPSMELKLLQDSPQWEVEKVTMSFNKW